MFGWRSPNLVRLAVGQHIVNGLSAGVGVVGVAIVASTIVGFEDGVPAWLGALAASISDYPSPWRDKLRTLCLGFALALIATAAIQLARLWPPADLLTIGAIAFAGGMVTGLGRWAVAVGMQALIPMVLMLGFPRETLQAALRIESLFAAGGIAYIAYALVATVVTDRSSRLLVAGEAIRDFAIYLRTVAAIFDLETDLEAAYGAAIRQQAALSEQLQTARSLLLDHARSTPENIRLAATIGVLLDALDALIAAQCDVGLIRDRPESAGLLRHIDAALRVGASDLEHLSFELLTTGHPILPPDHSLAIDALKREAAAVESDGASDNVGRDALLAATHRLTLALENVRRLEKALSDDRAAEAVIGSVDLVAFIPKRSYSLKALGSHFTLSSPVLRFSVRMALAMMAGSIIAQSLGEKGHGNWVLLTIAVVMRAGYGLTRQRRDDRVVGTLIGCVAAVGAVAALPVGALVAVQGLGVAVTHSFARLNYRIASVGASVTALVSLHLADPSLPSPVLVRLADTLVGAAIAHLFSFVWPHWEFSEAPRIATRLQAQLAVFAAAALKDASVQDYRLARKNMIEALSALSDSAGRMSIEPTTTRKGLDEMAALLIAAHGLIAELSAARLDAQLGVAPSPAGALGDWIEAVLTPKAGLQAGEEAQADAPTPAGRLAVATLRVVKAARRYRRAAEIEAGDR